LNTVKQKLFDLCQSHLAKRIATATEAIQIAQSAANEETKSSAGDKYETGRAMMQLEIEKNSAQLDEALKLKLQLDQINLKQPSAIIQGGSLVITNHGNFFIAIGAGKLVADEQVYFAISMDSPIGSRLKGLQQGAAFVFNNRTYEILKVW
jgi:hypothetical protein